MWGQTKLVAEAVLLLGTMTLGRPTYRETTGQCDVQKLENGHGDGQKLPPKLNKSASGSQCGEVSMSFWQETSDAGTKQKVQFLPPFARYWSGLEAEHTRFLANPRRQ